MAAPWAFQDQAWYGTDGNEKKGHVQLVARKLNQLCEQGDWVWPGLVEEGYKSVAAYLKAYLSLDYSDVEIKDIVTMLHKRHVIFTKLLATGKLTWNHDNNTFEASKPEVWDKLLKEETYFGWYRDYGEPLWDELSCIFEGWSTWHGSYAENPDCLAASWDSDPSTEPLEGLVVKDSEDEDGAEVTRWSRGTSSKKQKFDKSAGSPSRTVSSNK